MKKHTKKQLVKSSTKKHMCFLKALRTSTAALWPFSRAANKKLRDVHLSHIGNKYKSFLKDIYFQVKFWHQLGRLARNFSGVVTQHQLGSNNRCLVPSMRTYSYTHNQERATRFTWTGIAHPVECEKRYSHHARQKNSWQLSLWNWSEFLSLKWWSRRWAEHKNIDWHRREVWPCVADSVCKIPCRKGTCFGANVQLHTQHSQSAFTSILHFQAQVIS